MAKSYIRRDRHSLYVRANGAVFRPVLSTTVKSATHHRTGTVTIGSDGELVTVRIMAQALFLSVTFSNGTHEYWSTHGSYLKELPEKGFIDSELVWQPA